jgi:hypothetical protein
MIASVHLEEPAIVLGVPEDEIDFFGEGDPPKPEFLAGLLDELRKSGFQEDHLPVEETAIGRGASGLALLIALAAVFLSGKSINENLDAWIAIAGKVKGLVQRIRKKTIGPVYYSESVCFALVVSDVLDEAGDTTIPTLRFAQVFPVRGGFLTKADEEDFKTNPVRHYLFVFEAGGHVEIVWMKSTGEIVRRDCLPIEEYYQFHGFYPDAIADDEGQ